MFLLFFGLVQVSGFFLIEIIKFYDGGYKVEDQLLLSISIITLIALNSFLFFYFLLKKVQMSMFHLIKLPKIDGLVFKKLNIVFIIIGLSGLFIFFIKNGFTLFKIGGYENKNLANLGIGYARIMYGYGLNFALISYLAVGYTKKKFNITVLWSILIGSLIFVIIGGGRSSSLGLLVLTITIALYYNRIKLRKLVLLGISFIGLVFLLTVARYKLTFNSNNISLFLYQFQGSFSPVDSFAKIVEVFPNNYKYNPELMFNSFLTLIPRALWVAKPINIEVASVYFTQEVLNYKSFLTISPTLLGELFIYYGYLGIITGMFLCALLVRVLTVIYIKSQRSLNMKIFFLLNALFSFSLFREGLSIALRDFLFFSIIFTMLSFFLKLVALSSNKNKL
jgi:hypothetical protein